MLGGRETANTYLKMSSTAQNLYRPSQETSLILDDGTNRVSILVSDIDQWNLFNVTAAISFGVQAGTFCIMFIMTAVLTRSTRRRTPVHILNLLSLFLGFFRALFEALYYTSNWNGFFAFFLQDYTYISSRNYALSILSIITPLLFAITVTCSLVLQAHTVTKVVAKKWHSLISCVSVLILIVAIGFRFANTILNCKAVLHTRPYFDFQWLQLSVLITETITIWFFSLIFTGKLVYTMWVRKKMDLPAWRHLKVLSIMGTCTMIVPSIFATIYYIDLPTFPSIDTWPMSTVALLLPLSSLWASMIINQPDASFDISRVWSESSQTFDSKYRCDSLSGKPFIHDSNTSSNWDDSIIKPLYHVAKPNSQLITTKDDREDGSLKTGVPHDRIQVTQREKN